ncbi:MAG TPA: YtcA family lipoprotein [Paraburkholderia sp.]|uniref:YtcA family lipoprotein n=1 Tax=Paraburkholderia sp. TaxID=1926495 RepID=UPI002BF92CC2|nr:YtcA family lipoprotein [Paraburkholderia sp.]HTR07322.1 YtcA family lipoprotein [Paraburkholderia sp.]
MSLSNVLSLASLSVAGFVLGGCAFAPSIPLFGAAFPDWLFCVVGGVASTVAVHLVLGRPEARSVLAPHAISYPALSALIAMAAWLVFFSR